LHKYKLEYLCPFLYKWICFLSSSLVQWCKFLYLMVYKYAICYCFIIINITMWLKEKKISEKYYFKNCMNYFTADILYTY